MNGKKIIDGLKAAVAGDFSRVTIEGQVWVRQRKWDEGEHEGCGIDSERAEEIWRLREALRAIRLLSHDPEDDNIVVIKIYDLATAALTLHTGKAQP